MREEALLVQCFRSRSSAWTRDLRSSISAKSHTRVDESPSVHDFALDGEIQIDGRRASCAACQKASALIRLARAHCFTIVRPPYLFQTERHRSKRKRYARRCSTLFHFHQRPRSTATLLPTPTLSRPPWLP
eukprot:6182328-Pleurochrysis_carterae.AAC.1